MGVTIMPVLIILGIFFVLAVMLAEGAFDK